MLPGATLDGKGRTSTDHLSDNYCCPNSFIGKSSLNYLLCAKISSIHHYKMFFAKVKRTLHMAIGPIQGGIHWVTFYKILINKTSWYILIEKTILHRISIISMDHTHGINDVLGQKLTILAFKHAQDVSYCSTNIEK